jgi:hypothetical protein
MFEQASIDSSGLLKRPWAMTVSLAGQAAALSAVALVSLIPDRFIDAASRFLHRCRSTSRAFANTRPIKRSGGCANNEIPRAHFCRANEYSEGDQLSGT